MNILNLENREMIATREAYGRVLVELGKRYRDLVVLDADLSKSTKTSEFAKHYPERFFNMGIAEQNLMGTAAGFALAGKIPCASTFAVFAVGRAFDQVRNSIAYPALNVKIVASHAGITVGEDGASHQSVEDISLMRSLPNMTVIVPADATETARAVEAAVEYRGPVYIRLGRPAVPVLFGADYEFRIGRAAVLREGEDAVIFATGIMVYESLKAAVLLAEEGTETAVVNVSTIKPLDEQTVINWARKAGAVVTAEEHSIYGGLGSAVAEVLGENCPVPLERVGIRDRFGESGSPDKLLEAFGLTAPHIAQAVRRVRGRRAAGVR
ncbi:putative transketolase [Thermacetogenium phaeum DSM 12270]|uniref:Putative transketolase n=1 Tax=Thermacetogenium phaeum (strain ATCC BAA-254 / DSM 26808 / PB) TaxID=1089553 RepID=K4LD57_THEPS|nr:transketolase family protein [Thermacetogenium phaeum]AFV10886.1 putative transketolase [Thermacetogenium phaeum DSM 12270]